MARVHGIVVTYRRPAELATMLARLDRQHRRPDTLIVVDNDIGRSARSVVVDAPAGLGTITYLPAGANLGPAGGLALGMTRRLAAADDDWLLLIDDDDPPRTDDMVARLVTFGTGLRASDPRVAAVGMSGTHFDPRRARTVRVPDAALAGAVSSPCIGGNQLPLYSVHAVRQVGVFDERLFFGFEELEYGMRLGAAGYRLVIDGDLWLRERTHHGRLALDTSPSRTLSAPSWRRYYSVRNLIEVLRRRGYPGGAARLAARSIAKPLVNVPRSPRLALAHLRMNTRAVADAYTGRLGRTVEPG